LPVDLESAAAASRELERIFGEAKHSRLPWYQPQTIRHAVTPILKLAGWTDDLIQENFEPSAHHLRHADIRLGNRFRTEGLIEVKPFGQDIYKSENRDGYANPLDQTIRYLDDSNIGFGVLTDAVDWLLLRRAPSSIYVDGNVRFFGARFKLDELFINPDCVSLFLGFLSPRAVAGWGETVTTECCVALKTEHRGGAYQHSGVLLAEFSSRPTGTDRRGMSIRHYFSPWSRFER
jgi:hypothetical protein